MPVTPTIEGSPHQQSKAWAKLYTDKQGACPDHQQYYSKQLLLRCQAWYLFKATDRLLDSLDFFQWDIVLNPGSISI